MSEKAPPAALLALDGRHYDTLTREELELLSRNRNGRKRCGLPWITIGFRADGMDPWAWLHALSQSEMDELLRDCQAIVRVLVYD